MYCVRKHLQRWLYTPHHKINSYPITFALASVNLMQFQLDLGGFSFVSSIRLSQQGRKPGWFGRAAQEQYRENTGCQPIIPPIVPACFPHAHCRSKTVSVQRKPSARQYVWYRKIAGKKKQGCYPSMVSIKKKKIKKEKEWRNIKGQKSLSTSQFSNGAEASGTAKISQKL